MMERWSESTLLSLRLFGAKCRKNQARKVLKSMGASKKFYIAVIFSDEAKSIVHFKLRYVEAHSQISILPYCHTLFNSRVLDLVQVILQRHHSSPLILVRMERRHGLCVTFDPCRIWFSHSITLCGRLGTNLTTPPSLAGRCHCSAGDSADPERCLVCPPPP